MRIVNFILIIALFVFIWFRTDKDISSDSFDLLSQHLGKEVIIEPIGNKILIKIRQDGFCFVITSTDNPNDGYWVYYSDVILKSKK